jgi:hypothetical protein
MSVKRFKFVSPGVFVNEIDNSQLPTESGRVGPVIIGRTERGPAMRPVTVKSQSELIEMFGNPIPGGQSGDVWREGNYQSPTYASYAAMAYLRNNGPVTMVRLLGNEHENRDSTNGKAGWAAGAQAYGLFIWNDAAEDTAVTGTLAAIWYFDAGVVALSGTAESDGSALREGTNVAIDSVGANLEFKAALYETADASGDPALINFNFTKTSDRFIRKVFNTNPALQGAVGTSPITEALQSKYFLGQTFEDHINEHVDTDAAAGEVRGMICKLADAGSNVGGNFQDHGGAAAGTSGWVLSQQLGTDTGSYDPKTTGGCKKLFRVNAQDCGEWESSNLKISIEDIRYSHDEDANPYGTFTVAVRKLQDNDGAPKFLERFTMCNLNPQSPNYVKRKVGDQTLEWVEDEKRYKVVGDYPNNSKFVRIEVNSELDAAVLDPELLPFGFQGPPQLIDIEVTRGDAVLTKTDIDVLTDNAMISDAELKNIDGTDFRLFNTALSLVFPKIRVRESTGDKGDNLPNRKAAYWGINTNLSGSNLTNRGWSDLVYPLPAGLGKDGATSDHTQMSWAVTLDDISQSVDGDMYWAADNRKTGDSISINGKQTGASSTDADGNYKDTLDEGADKFTMPLWGGFDGVDITTLDPFAPDLQLTDTATERTSYEYYSIKKGIDMCADSEVVECNVITVPGCTNAGINQHLVAVAENRADCLAILDLPGGYLPRANRTADETSFSDYGGSVTSTLTKLKDLGVNSSYACCYYPWVQVRDTTQDAVVWVPPSVVALGTMGSSEAQSELWFAPAGFTRGGLTEGSAGLPVLGVRDRLTSKQRDDLYLQNVNPIATFPAEGIVIFGQKTMQQTRSALDRINVRRLMIFVKKEISRMAATTLFDQNVKSTWNRFLGRVNPFLRSVQSRLGLVDFKVILDETTTTPELIDRNIMYAKILLKPARAIEFIAVDFVITDSGASFED